MVDRIQLRTLIVRHLARDNLTILIRSLNIPVLKKLKLVYLYVALVHYKELRQVVNRKHVPRLQQFHFSIRLP